MERHLGVLLPISMGQILRQILIFFGFTLIVLAGLSGLVFGQTADLEIAQTAYHNGNASDVTTFTIYVTNNGPDDATNIVVTDNLNASWNFNNPTTSHSVSSGTLGWSGTSNRNLTWSIPLIRNGETAVLVFNAVNNYADWQISSPFNNANTATITALDQTDPVGGNNAFTINTTLEWNTHNLSITKSASNENPVLGSLVQFTVTVNRIGSSGNGVTIQVTDKLPDGFTYVSSSATHGSYNSSTGIWDLGITSYTLGTNTATLTISATADVPGTFTNVAFFSHGGPDSDVTNNIATVDVSPTPDLSATDLSVTKSVDLSTQTVGQDVIFTVKAKNNGDNDATGVVVNDLLPNGYAYVSHTATNGNGTYIPGTGVWTIGDLDVDDEETLTVTATVQGTGNYANTATVAGAGSDPVPGNNYASATVTPYLPEADLQIVKEINNPAPTVGSNVVFTIEVENEGPDDATGVVVNDLLPDGYSYVSHIASNGSYNQTTGVWTIGALTNAGTATLTITATVQATGNYTNTATVTGGVDDPDPGNNSASAGLSNVLDLGITKTVDEDEPLLGTNIVFTLAATNHGASTATGVVMTDVLPSGYDFVSSTQGVYNPANRTVTWNVGMLSSSATASFTITAKVKGSGNFNNTATVTANEPDQVPANNSDSQSVTPDITDALDLRVVQTVSTEIPNVGNSVTFTITASYQGANDATGVTVSNLLGNGLQFVSATPSTGSYNSGMWTIGTMAPSATATLTITAEVLGDVGAAYLSIAEITANEIDFDNNIINNRAYSILSPIEQDFHPCDVNAEEPAFTEDFGSGASPYGPELVAGRTNMVYMTGVNIEDGQYTIAKNAQLGYDNWANITDPSDDPNGYFMIVNAGIEPHEFFRTRITLSDEFCTNTRYNISFKVINVNSFDNYDYCTNNEGGLILPEIGYFVINDKGEILGAGTSGEIPYNAIPEWLDRQFVFVSGTDDEWVEIVFFNKAPGGCGNDLAIDNITVYACMTPPIRLEMIIENEKLEVCGGETVTMTVNYEEDAEEGYQWPPQAWGGEFGIVEYQWQRSDDGINYTDIPGETTDVLVIENFGPEDQAYYRLMYAQLGNIDKEFCRFPSAQFYPVFNATPVPGPIESVVDEEDFCVDTGPFQLTSEYDFSGYDEEWEEENPYFVWNSSNTGVATIDQNGLLTPVAPGSVTITYLVYSLKGECEGFITRTINIRDAECNVVAPSLLITNPMIRQRVTGGGDEL